MTPPSRDRWGARDSTPRWWASPPAPTTTATAWWPPTAASSPSGRRPFAARPATWSWPGRSWAWRPRPGTSGNGVLAGGLRRRDLQLRGRRLLRIDRWRGAGQPGGGDGADRWTVRGYWFASADGSVYAEGDAVFSGAVDGLPLNAPVVGLAAGPPGPGLTGPRRQSTGRSGSSTRRGPAQKVEWVPVPCAPALRGAHADQRTRRGARGGADGVRRPEGSTTMIDTEHLTYEVVGTTAVVTMNRPEAKNALSGPMLVGHGRRLGGDRRRRRHPLRHPDRGGRDLLRRHGPQVDVGAGQRGREGADGRGSRPPLEGAAAPLLAEEAADRRGGGLGRRRRDRDPPGHRHPGGRRERQVRRVRGAPGPVPPRRVDRSASAARSPSRWPWTCC